MSKKKTKKNGNGKVGGKADVHLNSNGSRNKSLLGHNAIFTPEVIDDIDENLVQNSEDKAVDTSGDETKVEKTAKTQVEVN